MISKNFQEEIIKKIFNFLEIKYPLEEFTKLYDLEGGYAFKSQTYSDKGIFVLRVTNIEKNSEINKEDVKYFPEDQIDTQLKKYLLKVGDVLVVMVGGSLGKVGFVKNKDVPAILNQNMWRVRSSKEKMNPKYTYYLTRYINHSKIKIKSSTHGHMSREMYRQIKIPHIDEKTQDLIADYLDNLFLENPCKIPSFLLELKSKIDKIVLLNNFYLESVSLNKDNKNYINKLRQQILQEAVQGKLISQDPKDEPASELLKKIKAEKDKLIRDGKIKKQKPLDSISEDEIPYELPKGWEWVRLGDICDYGSSDKTEGKNLKDNVWVLDLEDIESISSKLIAKIRFLDRKSKSTKNIFYKGDVLFNKLRPYLDKVLVADESGVCTTEILPLRVFGNNLNPFYLRWFLKSPSLMSYINSVTYGMKMPRLGTEDGKKALIPLPPLPEQKRIVEKVDKLIVYCNELEKQVKENQENSEKLVGAVLKESFA
ncbi:MAG: restriction endonuclease subunit S [archaeon]|nr:restriction endonuclease subunit S [archaeon]